MEERIHLAAHPGPDSAGLPLDLHDGSDVHDLPARRVTRAALSVLGLRLVGAGAGVLVAGLLARQLGPGAFGELSVIFSLAILASTVAELGTSYVVVAEMAARPWRRPELAAGVAVIRAAAGLVLATIGAVVLWALLHRPGAGWAGLAVMATLPLAGVSGLVVLHQARVRPEIGAALSLAQSLVWLAAVVIAGVFDAPLAFYGLAFFIAGTVQAVASWATVRGERPVWSSWAPAARWILRHSWPLGVATILGAIYYRLDAVLVFKLAGATAAGFYSAAYRFLDVLQLVPIALSAVLLPRLAAAWTRSDAASCQRVLRLAVTVAGAVALPIAAIAVVAGDRIATAVFGNAFTPAGDVLRVLPLAFFSIATGYVYAGMLVAMGKVRLLAVVAAIAAAGSVVADLLVIPVWGATGAAWVTVGVEYFVSSTLAGWIGRRVGFRFPWARVRGAAAASVVLGLVAWPLRSAPLLLLLVLPAAAYVAAARAFGAFTDDDLRSLAHPTLALGGDG